MPRKVQTAHSMNFTGCPSCNCVHVEFYDAAHEVFAEGVIPLDMCDRTVLHIDALKKAMQARVGKSEKSN